MISEEDFECIVALDSDAKAIYLKQSPDQAARTLLNLLAHVSKDTTIQYILVLIDDLLQEDRTRVDIFHEYAVTRKENVWGPFLNLLNRSNGFIVNMASRILAKLACWTAVQMPKADLQFYLQFLKDQLTQNVSVVFDGKCIWVGQPKQKRVKGGHRSHVDIRTLVVILVVLNGVTVVC